MRVALELHLYLELFGQPSGLDLLAADEARVLAVRVVQQLAARNGHDFPSPVQLIHGVG